MRIQVHGNGPVAIVLRGNLCHAGFVVTADSPSYELFIEEADAPGIVLDGVDSELERKILNCVSELTPTPILLQRAGGIQSDRSLRVLVGPGEQDRLAVERGVLRGLLQATKMDTQTLAPLPFWRTWKLWGIPAFLLLLIVLLLVSRSFGQQVGAVDLRRIGGTPQSAANVVDAPNTALRVNCVVGCGGAVTANQGSPNTQANRWPVFWSNGATERGLLADPLRIDPTGTTAQPVTQFVPPWTFRMQDGAGVILATVTAANAVKVDGSAVTQPVDVSDRAARLVGQVEGRAASGVAKAGNPNQIGAVFNTVQPIVSSGQVVESQATIRGAVIVAPGVEPFFVNQSSPPWTQRLQDGTSATLAAVTVGNALKVDGSAVTQPVSIAAAVDVSDRAARLVGQVEGRAASGAAKAGNPNQIGAVFNTTQPTVSTGQAVESQATTRGSLIVAPGVDNTAANAWFTKITDGTNVAAVLATLLALKIDLSSVAGTATVNGGVAGTMATGGTGANDTSITQNPHLIGVEALSSQPTAATTGNLRRVAGSLDGALYARPYGPIIWSCGLAGVANVLTQCQAAPGAGLSLYITDIIAQSNTMSPSLWTIRFGTGVDCGTGTGNLLFGSPSATLPGEPFNATLTPKMSFVTPIKVTANNALCVLGIAGNTTNININGFTAP